MAHTRLFPRTNNPADLQGHQAHRGNQQRSSRAVNHRDNLPRLTIFHREEMKGNMTGKNTGKTKKKQPLSSPPRPVAKKLNGYG